MSTLFVLLLSLAPQSGDLADLEHLNPDVRELTARVAGLKKTNAAVPHLIQRLGDESAKVREAAQAALESITGRSDLKDAAGWKSWWIAEGRKEFPSALLPPEGVLLQIQKEMQDLDVRAQ